MNKIRLTKEERTALFLEWLDSTLEERGWRAEQVATKGDFDSSVITAYRKGKSAVGPKVAERAARAFGYDDEQTLKLLQRLQLVPGGSDDTEDGKAQQRGKHFARSPWDTLHPGRLWAAEIKENQRSLERIAADLAKHFQSHPPYKDTDAIIKALLTALKQH